ncbi:hypothetical protein C7974DRAFT_475959 [Boeremia exigua]|uniref:uncharacterized protein n=1 Tax=Boeremia exigua TaxID=749465 RepID=UPI001E8DFEA1|nr:uncharacterized protein C7974DRAFT_475959 [Boeremia exigua]KAH6614158.1 hypothetical protein C7974DRAFT_475959 [Boeremia exigua]
MMYHTLSVDMSALDAEVSRSQQRAYDGEPVPSQSQDRCQQNEETLDDASSIYSDHGSEETQTQSLSAASRTLHEYHDNPGLALPYQEVIAEMRAKTYPARPKEDSHDDSPTPSRPVSWTESSTIRSNDARWRTSPKTSLETTSGAEPDAFRPVMYTEPRLQTNGKLRSLRFQDTAGDLPAPSLEWSQAEGKPPLRIDDDPKKYKQLLRGSRSTLSSRPRFAASVASLWVDKRSEDGLDVSQACTSTEHDDQVCDSLTKEPVKKGWFRKIRQAFAEYKQKRAFRHGKVVS